MKQEEIDQHVAAIKSGKVVTFDGRSAATLDELAFNLKAAGHDGDVDTSGFIAGVGLLGHAPQSEDTAQLKADHAELQDLHAKLLGNASELAKRVEELEADAVEDEAEIKALTAQNKALNNTNLDLTAKLANADADLGKANAKVKELEAAAKARLTPVTVKPEEAPAKTGAASDKPADPPADENK